MARFVEPLRKEKSRRCSGEEKSPEETEKVQRGVRKSWGSNTKKTLCHKSHVQLRSLFTAPKSGRAAVESLQCAPGPAGFLPQRWLRRLGRCLGLGGDQPDHESGITTADTAPINLM